MKVQTPALDRLREEYIAIGETLAARSRLRLAEDPQGLRLVAREMEIVDAIRAAGLAPDVLLKGAAA